MKRSVIPWVLGKISDDTSVDRIENISDDKFRIVRHDLPDFICIVCDVKIDNVEEIFEISEKLSDVDVVLNVPQAAYWSGEAIGALRRLGIAYARMGDLGALLGEKEIREFASREWMFVERGFRQHKNIARITCLSEGYYEVERVSHRKLRIAIIIEYEATANSIRKALERFPDADIVVNTHPLGTFTTEASNVGEEVGVELQQWKGLLARLHRA